MQEQRNHPSDRASHPLVCESKLLERSDHVALDQDAVNHGGASPYDSRHCERRVLPGHFIPPAELQKKHWRFERAAVAADRDSMAIR
jgi:hypothetical protein